MRIPPLPETDLANIAPLPPDIRRRALEALRLSFPPYSYAPVRANLSDILNIQTRMFGALPRTPWAKIRRDIVRRSKKDSEEIANLRVAEGLFKYVDEESITGRRHEIFPLPLGVGTRVVFWTSVVLLIGGRPLVPFFDPRRTKSLSRTGRRFVFSVQHERVRAADPDFAEVNLGVVQFALSEKGPRKPIVHFDIGIELFTFEQLDAMVRDTYAVWREVCEEREAASRRRADGSI